MAIPLRQHIDVRGPRADTTTPYYREVCNLMKEIQLNPALTCMRMYSPKDPHLADTYFKVAAGILPSKARLHHLNPRRWEDPNCTWCRTPGDLKHTFIECQQTRPIWEWLRTKMSDLEPQSTPWSDEEILELRYPEATHNREIAYLTMKVMNYTWNFTRQHRVLSVQRLTEPVKHDIDQRAQLKLPSLAGALRESL